MWLLWYLHLIVSSNQPAKMSLSPSNMYMSHQLTSWYGLSTQGTFRELTPTASSSEIILAPLWVSQGNYCQYKLAQRVSLACRNCYSEIKRSEKPAGKKSGTIFPSVPIPWSKQ